MWVEISSQFVFRVSGEIHFLKAQNAFSWLLGSDRCGFVLISSIGILGGILSGWNPKLLKCKAYHTVAGILLKAMIRGSTFSLSILNCYSPYLNREPF